MQGHTKPAATPLVRALLDAPGIGAAVRAQRRAAGWTQADLAQRAGKNILGTYLRRAVIWLVAGGAVALQATSCGFLPELPPLSTLSKNTPESASSPRQQTPGVATSFRDCPQFFAGGVAPVVPKAPLVRELCYDAFAILHSGETKTPVFVAQRLSRASVADADEKRADKFFADARLPRAERAELGDYKGSGYSRGHMAPAGDMPTPAAMVQSFSLANMVPQNPRQNSGPWAKIEKDTRHYVARAKGEVFIITGPFFGPGSTSVGTNQVGVPTHIFKLVYDATTHKSWAHWQPNSDDARAGPPISYSELSGRIGMELLPGVALR